MRYLQRFATLALILSLCLLVWGPLTSAEAPAGHLPGGWPAQILQMVNWYEGVPTTLPFPRLPAWRGIF